MAGKKKISGLGPGRGKADMGKRRNTSKDAWNMVQDNGPTSARYKPVKGGKRTTSRVAGGNIVL